MRGTYDGWFWFANLGRGVGEAEFVRNLTRVLEAAKRTDAHAIALVEIDEADLPDEHRHLRRLADQYGYDIACGSKAAPILVHRGEIVSEKSYFGCPGLPGVTPRRWVNEAVTEFGDGELSVDCTHKPLKRPATGVLRAAVHAVLQRRVRANARRGRMAVYALDANEHGAWRKLTRRRNETFRRFREIDIIGACAPTGWDVDIIDTRVANLTIDRHDAYGVRIRFTEPR